MQLPVIGGDGLKANLKIWLAICFALATSAQAEPWNTQTEEGRFAMFYDLYQRAGGVRNTARVNEPLPVAPNGYRAVTALPPDLYYDSPATLVDEWHRIAHADLRATGLSRFSGLGPDLLRIRRESKNDEEFQRRAVSLIRVAPIIYSHLTPPFQRDAARRALNSPKLQDRGTLEIFYRDYYDEIIAGALTDLEDDKRLSGLTAAREVMEASPIRRDILARSLGTGVSAQGLLLRRIHPQQTAYLNRINIPIAGLPPAGALAREDVYTYLIGKGDKRAAADQGILVVVPIKTAHGTIPHIVGASGAITDDPKEMDRLAAMLAHQFGAKEFSVEVTLAPKFQRLPNHIGVNQVSLPAEFTGHAWDPVFGRAPGQARTFDVAPPPGPIYESAAPELVRTEDLAKLAQVDRDMLNRAADPTRYGVTAMRVKDYLKEGRYAAAMSEAGYYPQSIPTSVAMELLGPHIAQAIAQSEQETSPYVLQNMARFLSAEAAISGNNQHIEQFLAQLSNLRGPGHLAALRMISTDRDVAPLWQMQARRGARSTCSERFARITSPFRNHPIKSLLAAATLAGSYYTYQNYDRWMYPVGTPLPDLSCEERGGKTTEGASGTVGCLCPDGRILHESRESRCDQTDGMPQAKFETEDAEIYDLLTADLIEAGRVEWKDKQEVQKSVGILNKNSQALHQIDARRHETGDKAVDPAKRQAAINEALAAARGSRQRSTELRAIAYRGFRERLEYEAVLYREMKSALEPQVAARVDAYLKELESLTKRVPDPKTIKSSATESVQARELLGEFEDWQQKVANDPDKRFHHFRSGISHLEVRDLNLQIKDLREQIEYYKMHQKEFGVEDP